MIESFWMLSEALARYREPAGAAGASRLQAQGKRPRMPYYSGREWWVESEEK